MAMSRADRRKAREARVLAVFGMDRAPHALDLLELVEFAWHDCYDEITPPAEIVDDMLFLSEGHLDRLIEASLLAVTDWRDLKVAAEERRRRHSSD